MPNRDGSRADTGPVRTLRLVDQPAAGARARAFVVEALREWRVERAAVDDAELVVSELVTNAFLHGRATDVTVVVADAGPVVRLEISHHETAAPGGLAPLTVGAEETHGRGLAIVDLLAGAWGVDELEGRRRVWAELVAARSGLLTAAEREPALAELTAALDAPADPRAVGDTVTGWGRDRLAASFVGIALADVADTSEPTDHLHYLSVEPLPGPSGAAWRRFPVDTDAPVAAAFRHARPYFHESRSAAVAGFPGLGPALAASGVAALAHLPLLATGRPVGTLAFAWSHGRELDAVDRSWLALVAEVTAVALARAGVHHAPDPQRAGSEAR